jgi:hypothetical protein
MDTQECLSHYFDFEGHWRSSSRPAVRQAEEAFVVAR